MADQASHHAPCENHADRAATHTAAMKSPTPPYDREVPLCAECAPRIERIGFTVTPIEPLPWPEGTDDGDYVRHPDADKFTPPTWENPGRCICGAELPPEKDWNDAGRDWSWVKCSACPRGYVEWVMILAREAWRLKSKAASGLGDVWRVPQEPSPHPAPFPVALPAGAIETTGPGSVLDPFAGSGSTLVAAKRAGVPAVGIEKSERYCEMAVDRLAQGVLAL